MKNRSFIAPDAATLARLEPLAALSGERRAELAEVCIVESTPRGGDPFRLHRPDDGVSYLVAGELLLHLADGTSYVLVGGHDRAQRPLGRFLPAITGARAITDVVLLRLDSQMLDIMLTWDQLLAAPATQRGEAAGERSAPAFPLPILTSPAFSQLPAAHIEALLARFVRLDLPAGAVVVREGAPGDYYYLIEAGRCRVSRRVGGDDLMLAELRPGDAFGEEALLAQGPRGATVTMLSDGVLLRLAQADFTELLKKPLLHPVTRAQAERLAAEGAIWLDVRFPAEYRHEHPPGAINLPLNEIRNALGVLDRARDYIVYCQSGRRSSAAAFLLAQHGYRAWWLESGLRGEAPAS